MSWPDTLAKLEQELRDAGFVVEVRKQRLKTPVRHLGGEPFGRIDGFAHGKTTGLTLTARESQESDL